MENHLFTEEAVRKEITAVTCKQLMLKYLLSKYHGYGMDVEQIINQYRFDVALAPASSWPRISNVDISKPSTIDRTIGTVYTTPKATIEFSKSDAKIILYRNGIQLPHDFTFAHKGDIAYWANPNEKLFKQPYWHLVLRDDDKNILHYFKVPGEICRQLVRRHDLPHLFDVQIDRNDINFTDRRSGVKFIGFHVKSINC